MNEFYQKALLKDHDRYPVYDWVIKNHFRGQPVNILDIGATRFSHPSNISGDGGSSIYWADYIAEHGGHLTIVDIDPIALQRNQEILSDFIGKIKVSFVCNDGVLFLRKNNNFDFIYLDGGDSPDEAYEEFRAVNLTKSKILCDDFNSKGIRLSLDYPFYRLFEVNWLHRMAFYDKVENEPTYKIGQVDLLYNREDVNSAWLNERSVELALGRYFAEKHNNNIIELGAVCNQYSFFKQWPIVDPYDKYEQCIRNDILDFDYTDKNVLSISTIEHCGVDGGYDRDKDINKSIQGLEKIIKEAKNYLITWPINAHNELDNFLAKSLNIPYTILKRKEYRGPKNEWIEDKNIENFKLPYGHLSYGLYGNALAVCVVSNLPEIIKGHDKK